MLYGRFICLSMWTRLLFPNIFAIFKAYRQNFAKSSKMTNIFKRFLKYTLTTYYAWILKWGRRSGDFGLLYYLHQPTRLKIVKMSHDFIGLHTSFLIWLGLTQLTKLSLYIYWTYGWLKRPCSQKTNIDGKTSSIKIDHFHHRNNPNCVL